LSKNPSSFLRDLSNRECMDASTKKRMYLMPV
jgi:hypothetical protein